MRGIAHRIRVIAISNAANRLALGAGQIWMKQDDLSNLTAILEANKPEVPIGARRNYAGLSKGFVRLAVDMCDNHAQIEAGGLNSGLQSIERYVLTRVDERSIAIVSAIALFTRLGFREDVEQEFTSVSKMLNISKHEIRENVERIRESLNHRIAGVHNLLVVKIREL